METNQKPCEFCGGFHGNDTDGYYAKKQCEAVYWWNRLKVETDPEERLRIARNYKLAHVFKD